MVHLGAHMHQAVTRLFGEPTMLKIVLHEVTFLISKIVGARWCTGAGALIKPKAMVCTSD